MESKSFSKMMNMTKITHHKDAGEIFFIQLAGFFLGT
jgi:hypothetical protein